MIRCYPVDGSEPFEVENDYLAEWFFEQRRVDDIADEHGQQTRVNDIRARIESWRERAERLEADLAKAAERIAHLESEQDPRDAAELNRMFAVSKR